MELLFLVGVLVSSERYRIVKSLIANTTVRYSMFFSMMFGNVTGTVTSVWTHPADVLMGCVFFLKCMTFGCEHYPFSWWVEAQILAQELPLKPAGKVHLSSHLCHHPLHSRELVVVSLVGYGDLIFCADMRVSDGPLALGLMGIGLLFLGEGESLHSTYCFPVLALRGMRLVLTTGFQVWE